MTSASLLMAAAVPFHREALAAVTALEIFFAQMHAHVVLHVAFLRMRGATNGARQELLATLVPFGAHQCLDVAGLDALEQTLLTVFLSFTGL